jgi:Mg-chelatase subunit ChlD
MFQRFSRVKTHHAPGKLYGPDRIGIVGFHDEGFPIAVPAEPDAPWLQRRALQLHDRVAGTSTNIAAGLRLTTSMLSRAPAGAIRRAWFLTDGHPNRDVEAIMPAVHQAREAFININTIGFGDPGGYDEVLLRRIARATHNGRFVPVNSLRQLTDALIAYAEGKRPQHHRHRCEYTVLAIDCSGSMVLPMEGKRRIDIVEEAVTRLLAHKRLNFA